MTNEQYDGRVEYTRITRAEIMSPIVCSWLSYKCICYLSDLGLVMQPFWDTFIFYLKNEDTNTLHIEIHRISKRIRLTKACENGSMT